MKQPVQRNFRWNFTVNVLDVGFFFFGLGFAGPHTTVVVFVHENAGSPLLADIRPLLIGLIGAMAPLGWHLPQLLTAGYIETLKRRKPFVLAAGILQRLPFLFMGVVAYLLGTYGGDWLLALFFIAYGLQTFSAGLVATAWQELMATVIPPLRRGMFFGTAFLVGGILMVVGGQLGGLALEWYPRPLNYTICFVVCFLITMISWGFLSQTRECETVPPKPRTGLRAYLRHLPQVIRENRNWRRYILSQAAIAPAGMAAIFVPIWGRLDLAIIDYEIGVMTSCAAAGETIANPLLGYLGDRRGHKVCLELATFAHILAMAAVLVFPNRVGLYLSLVLIGFYNAGRKVSATAIAFEFCEPADRPTYIGLTNTLLGPFFALGSIAGGILIIIFSYEVVFALSLVVAGGGVLFLAKGVHEPRHENNHLLL